MINYLENGETFSEREGSFNNSYREISKEEYARLSDMNYGDVNDEVKEGLGDAILWGYGYYGHKLIVSVGKYFLGIKTGNSCD